MALPTENLDNKTFDELVREAVARIPSYNKTWTDFNLHDPGITFIELFAWLTEMQLYRLNQVPDEIYRKFLKLVTITSKEFSANGSENFAIDLEKTTALTIQTLTVQGEAWQQVENFETSNATARHYMLKPTSGQIMFGNGEKGQIPRKGDKINVTYFLGGKQKEALDEGQRLARQNLKKITRAVTSQDYEDLVLALKENDTQVFGRVKAIPRYHPVHGLNVQVPGIVTVVVVPNVPGDSQPMPTAEDLRKVYQHLDQYRLLTTELFVIPPEYVGVAIEATIVIKPQYLRGNVETDVKKALKNFLAPVGIEGNKGWPFGRAVYRSEIFEIMDQVPGVDYVMAESLVLSAYPFTDWLKFDGKFQNGDLPAELKAALQDKDPSFFPTYKCEKQAAHIIMLIDPKKKVYYRIIKDQETFHIYKACQKIETGDIQIVAYSLVCPLEHTIKAIEM